MRRLQSSLEKWMIAFTATICLAAMGAQYWRRATRPDLSFQIVVQFSQPYSPPSLSLTDVPTIMQDMMPDDLEKDLSKINETIANVNLRLIPYGENAVEIVARGKSWHMQPETVELVARAASASITNAAAKSNVDAIVTLEIKTESNGIVPKSIMSKLDRH
jgi:hypothetical protein